jgi:hypothetical protein
MRRYIDADKYIEILRRHKSYFVRQLPESMNEAVILGLSMAISEAKGACDDDVVKVVWCEDGRYLQAQGHSIRYRFIIVCHKLCYGNYGGRINSNESVCLKICGLPILSQAR